MIKLPASTFKHMLKAATNETVADAGRSTGEDVPKTYIRAKWDGLTVENALNYLKITADHTSLFEYSEVMRDEKGKCHFRMTSAPRQVSSCNGISRRSSSR